MISSDPLPPVDCSVYGCGALRTCNPDGTGSVKCTVAICHGHRDFIYDVRTVRYFAKLLPLFVLITIYCQLHVFVCSENVKAVEV